MLPAFGLSPRARAVVNTAAGLSAIGVLLARGYTREELGLAHTGIRGGAQFGGARRGRSSPATASLWPFPPCARLSLPTSEQTAAKTSSNGSSCTSRSDGALRGTVVP